MRVLIKRLDQSLPLPRYHTIGSAGFDLSARVETTIAPKQIARIPSGLIIGTPTGYVLTLAARSSLASKKGLMLANGIGTIDSDFCGPEDEILISVYNFSDQSVTVEKGERIAQGLFLKVEQGEWEEVEEISKQSRGGFGSTDK
ncbi:MAG: dUTP diphosphatase [Candidatus Magasanikbacteria bacterium]